MFDKSMGSLLEKEGRRDEFCRNNVEFSLFYTRTTGHFDSGANDHTNVVGAFWSAKLEVDKYRA